MKNKIYSLILLYTMIIGIFVLPSSYSFAGGGGGGASTASRGSSSVSINIRPEIKVNDKLGTYSRTPILIFRYNEGKYAQKETFDLRLSGAEWLGDEDFSENSFLDAMKKDSEYSEPIELYFEKSSSDMVTTTVYNLNENFNLKIPMYTKVIQEGNIMANIENSSGGTTEGSIIYAVGQASQEKVIFSDIKLENAIREKLNKPDEILAESDVQKITTLDLTECGVADLTGIETLTNLEVLLADKNSIIDLTPLKGLTSLSRLELKGNQIREVSALAGLSNLKILYLEDNPIDDYSPLEDIYNNLDEYDFRIEIKKLTSTYEVGSSTMNINGKDIIMDVPMASIEGTKYLPVRYFSKGLGLSDECVVFDSAEKTLTFFRGERIVQVSLDKSIALVNGKEVELGCNIIMLNGRASVPASATFKLFDFVVQEDENILKASNREDFSGVDKINFPDKNLEKAVRVAIDKPEGAIRKEDVCNIEKLNLSSMEIFDIRGMENFTSLKELDLDNNLISNLTPLAGLINLEKLYIGKNNIGDFTPLSDLTNLQNLCLYNNNIESIEPLKNFNELIFLNMSGNKIPDLEPLKNLENLKYIRLHNNEISDLSPIANLTNLDEIGMYDNNISDLSPLLGLKNVTFLEISKNPIDDISGLANLTKLEILGAAHLNITDISVVANMSDLCDVSLSSNSIKDIEPLKELENLNILYLNDNDIDSIEALKNCNSIEYLGIKNNKIESIEILASFKNLKELFLEGNNITDYSPTKGYYANLMHKDFDYEIPIEEKYRIEIADITMKKQSEDFEIKIPEIKVLNSKGEKVEKEVLFAFGDELEKYAVDDNTLKIRKDIPVGEYTLTASLEDDADVEKIIKLTIIKNTPKPKPSGGGGGAPGVKTVVKEKPKTDNEILEKGIKELKEVKISLEAQKEDKTDISMKVLEKVRNSKKPLVIENKGVSLVFTNKALEADFKGLKEDASLEFAAEVVENSQKERIMSKAVKDTDLKSSQSDIFKVSFDKVKDGKKFKVTKVDEPLAIRIDLSDKRFTEEQIKNLTGVKYVEDKNKKIVPVKIGGDYDKKTKIFTLHTNELGFYGVSEANELKAVSLGINSQHAEVNKLSKTLDTPPTIIQNRTMIPLRFVAEGLGADIDWNGATKTVKLKLDGKEISLVIGVKSAGMDVPALIKNERTLVPLRYVSENLGANVLWYPSDKKIDIVK